MKKFLKVQQVLGKNLRSGGSKIVSKETLAYETGQKAESVNKLENLKKNRNSTKYRKHKVEIKEIKKKIKK